MDGLTLIPGVRRDFAASRRAAGRLLKVARARESLGRKRNPFLPFVHLLANIFLCAFAGRYLENDAGGIYLPLFIVIQITLGLLITLSFVGRGGAEILRKTRLFPGSSSAGYYFLLAGSLRRPELYLFSAVGCLFPATVYGHGIGASIGIVACSAMPAMAAQILLCAAATRLITASRPITGLVLIAIIAVVTVVVSVLVFRTEGLASSLPMVAWAASGIIGFGTGDAEMGWSNLAYLVLATAGILAFFGRYNDASG